MRYPLEKYKYFSHLRKEDNAIEVFAVSTYGGRTVKGKAVCLPGESFDESKYRKLAALSCEIKVAEKRAKRAKRRFNDSESSLAVAKKHNTDMAKYLIESNSHLLAAKEELQQFLKDFD